MNSCVSRSLLCLLVLAVHTLSAFADTIVEVHVTYVSGDSAYLDKGREAGLEVGDFVVLEGIGSAAPVKAELVAVSSSSARARIPAGAAPPAPGTLGAVRIPDGRVAPVVERGAEPRPDAQPPAVPDHPPWGVRLEGVDENTPLLAPAFQRHPSERPTKVRGRAFTDFLSTWDRGEERDSRFVHSRAGLDIEVENPFQSGGLLRAAGSWSRRVTEIEGLDDRTEDAGRIDRLFYRWGGGIDAPLQIQFGRFLPRDTPELGLVDGGEVTYAATNRTRIGVNLGFFPEPMPDRATFDDRQVTLSWRWSDSEEETVVLGAAAQQTWHDGNADRRLFLGKATYRPSRTLWLSADAWVDQYDGNDEIKSSGFELTEAHLNGRWTYSDGHGVGVGYAFLRNPELLRDEYTAVSRDFVERHAVARYHVSTFNELSDTLRLDTRLGAWEDQDDDGNDVEVALRASNLLREDLDLSVAAFRTDAPSLEGPGLRVTARYALDATHLSLGYQTSRQDLRRYGNGDATLTSHALFAGADFSIDDDWSVSLTADHRFGDSERATSVEIFLLFRF